MLAATACASHPRGADSRGAEYGEPGLPPATTATTAERGNRVLAESGGEDIDGMPDTSLAAPPAALPSVYRGSLKEGAIDATLRANAFRFRGCGLAGSAVVRVIVRDDGQVRTATLFRDHLTAGGLCLLEAVRGIPFPTPTGGDAEVLIPFVFRPKVAPQ